MRKVLICVPNLHFAGGVASLYQSLDLEQNGIADYFCFHNHEKEKYLFFKIVRLFAKYYGFFKRMRSFDLIVLNPSLESKSFLRDSVFAFLAFLHDKKFIVFWHGWENRYERKIKKSLILNIIFRKSFAKANAFIILGSIFKQKLIYLGVKEDSFFLQFSNIADDCFIKEFDISTRFVFNEEFTLLFLSRMEKEKGIYIAIHAFQLLQKEFTDRKLKLLIAGDGSELQNVCNYVKGNQIENVYIEGYITGVKKHEILKRAQLYLLPSWHGEGLPLTVLEAMLYGIPIVTRPIGGLTDIIKDEINGFLIKSLNPVDYVEPIRRMLLNKNLYQTICSTNHEFALNNFVKSKALQKFSLFLNSI